ncbi:MAG: RIP metalloprotease RseP [endosymbiont of Seepiophila jonesi]|uniref:Zinc metalloprotease n=1 Tax=endosymbiont of Lamellibrachia luymesi TaxID=2200907 RepID=A0A370DZZ7_9GAMM|nr:MAG: RIP metalloprotease RseP [endosymbiont of Seepiophila jonesi]RDH92532.1 MAG: RIP metalloprotease RseP [endosymbiont of Lamellibrachia luymesi]
MDSLLFTIAAFVVALGILITVHELGHFWVARRVGVKVLRFSIGFGKPLWTRVGKIDGTEYVLAAIPLGGYVKMLDEREAPVDPGELDRAFNRQTLASRTAIVLAGPLFNLLFAVFAFWLIFVTGDTGIKPLVGEVKAESIAGQAGFQTGDRILSVNQESTPTWETAVYMLLAESLDVGQIAVRVEDESGREAVRWLDAGRLQEMSEEAQILQNLGITPKRPVVAPVIGTLLPGEAADRDGLKTGDLLLSVDGQSLESWVEWVKYVRARPEQRMVLEVERAGSLIRLELTPVAIESEGESIGRIGASVHVPPHLMDDYQTEIRYGPLEAVGKSLYKTWDLSLLMLKMLGKMVIGEVSVKNLSGPISIAEYAGKTASYGLIDFLKFLAVVSISLGVLNLLPIPVLDGGHLLFFLLEAIKGGALSETFMEHGQKIGMILLLAMMSLAFYVDLSRLLG